MASDQSANSTSAKSESGRPAKLVDMVYEQLLACIRAGEFPPDGKLPGEHHLAERFDVSRPVVRDALSRLREENIVYSRQGAGTFVRAPARLPVLGFAPVESIADIQRCYEFRLTIEPEAAFYAARRRDEEALARIAASLAQLRDATRHNLHREDADFSFHRSVTAAANNHYYTSSIEALKQHISVGMHLHGLSLMGPNLRLRGVFDEHRLIYDAIAAGQADDARAAMRRHLEGSRDRLFEGHSLDLSL
jgi:GntR family transcriptional repressor for pyruvate dehydrogenase complex